MKKDNVLNDWNEKKQDQLDKKTARKFVWRTRLSISFTVIRILLILLLLYIAYMVPVQAIYHSSGKNFDFDRMVATIIETRYDGFAVEKAANDKATINPLLTQYTELTLYQNVGDWDVVIGTVTAEKRLFGKINYNLDFNQKYLDEHYGTDSFALPADLLEQKHSDAEKSVSDQSIWNQLEKIDDGHVVQLHFSTKESMKPEELHRKLTKYDLDILQLAVYSGEVTQIDVPSSWNSHSTFAPSLILRPEVVYDKDGGMHFDSFITKESLDDSIEQLYKDMEWLVDKGNYLDEDMDQERLAYLKNHELRVFGATVTGPIRELEKLANEEQFHYFKLDGIEIWNWDRE